MCTHPVGGQLAANCESKQVHWVEPDRLDQLNIHWSVMLRIDHGLQQGTEPYLS